MRSTRTPENPARRPVVSARRGREGHRLARGSSGCCIAETPRHAVFGALGAYGPLETR
ncbi:hypothetical protein [Streptomyces litmocidini]|uniref:hypothetical protein n=1 Tax=Streptomyces litmocidini TaxID=67318 RepID=UPI00167CF19B|nr:hypothetical protein [Streptomyces litmocidini]